MIIVKERYKWIQRKYFNRRLRIRCLVGYIRLSCVNYREELMTTATTLVLLSSGFYFLENWRKQEKILWENINLTFLLKFREIIYLKGHSRCEELQIPKLSKEKRLSESQGREVNDARELPCQKLLDWVSAALFSTKTNCRK